MITLGIDSSAVSVGAAVCDGEKIIADGFINNKITHSQTLMPLVEAIITNAKMTLADIDIFAVSAGPGSFTGLRIGVSAVKGMAYALGKPCKAVSTLDAMAYNLLGTDGIVCAVMDARCDQVYNALFEFFCIAAVFPFVVWYAASGSVSGKVSKKVCTFLGDISYPVYVVHYPFMYLFYDWVWDNKVPLAQAWPYGVLVIVGSILLAWVLFNIYDKPVRRWLLRRVR